MSDVPQIFIFVGLYEERGHRQTLNYMFPMGDFSRIIEIALKI